MIETLNEEKIFAACEELAARDADLASIFRRFGAPPLWARKPGFSTLVHIILEQQVSLASAKSAFDKLVNRLEILTPESFSTLSDEELKAVGFSRQKTAYCRGLADAVAERRTDLESFADLSDETIKTELIKLKGVGDWTADIYLLMAMLRCDVMPRGDLALHVAWQKLKRLERRPAADEFIITAERWKPLRAVAARLLWHFYLNAKKI